MILFQAKSLLILKRLRGSTSSKFFLSCNYLRRHARGEGVDTTKVRTKFKAKEQARREERVEFANVQAARAEVGV